MHVHIPVDEFLGFLGDFAEPALRYFNADVGRREVKEVLDWFASLGIDYVVVLPIDSTSFLGRRVGNDVVASLARDDRVVGFCSVDPHSRYAVAELRRCVRELGLRGLKLHPQLQGFDPSDPAVWPIYEEAQELGIPVIFHTGTSGIGAGLPGGGGLRLELGRPMRIDPVAASFPDLPIVLAHGGWPWTDEAIAMALHKANVYVDLSGWSPRYMPESIWRYSRHPALARKLLYGSDYPFISPERWLEEFRSAPVKDEARPLVLGDNARRVLGI